jgi:protein-S-isoprenylcysteine O-methyltransferase Ste14
MAGATGVAGGWTHSACHGHRWQIWTDAYLARYFDQGETPTVPMNQGPYRYVRHPQVAAAIAEKIAMTLIFASAVGCLLVLAWSLLLLNKISVEEKHLRELFGSCYESYARTTAKVIPGIR